eukprot:scaffold21487_cov105-Isochrysis_galbana.AAC.8
MGSSRGSRCESSVGATAADAARGLPATVACASAAAAWMASRRVDVSFDAPTERQSAPSRPLGLRWRGACAARAARAGGSAAEMRCVATWSARCTDVATRPRQLDAPPSIPWLAATTPVPSAPTPRRSVASRVPPAPSQRAGSGDSDMWQSAWRHAARAESVGEGAIADAIGAHCARASRRDRAASVSGVSHDGSGARAACEARAGAAQEEEAVRESLAGEGVAGASAAAAGELQVWRATGLVGTRRAAKWGVATRRSSAGWSEARMRRTAEPTSAEKDRCAPWRAGSVGGMPSTRELQLASEVPASSRAPGAAQTELPSE